MDQPKLRYELEEAPPFVEMIFLGLQWFVIAVPQVIIMGKIAGSLHFDCPTDQIVYTQKLFFISGISFLVQLVWGHRLPLVIGPSTILLVGIVASHASGINSVYTAIAIGGLFLFLLAAAGLLKYIKKIFTAPVVATILMLVSFTLTPMILDLITSSTEQRFAFSNICFALIFMICMFMANRYVTGLWKSTMIMWLFVAGVVVYNLLFPQAHKMVTGTGSVFFAGFFRNMNFKLSFEPGVIIAFIVCFLALAINDLGAMYTVGYLLQPDRMSERVNKGLTVTGFLNFLSGLLGVIGPVNFSVSPGVIISTGCASRYSLLPTGVLLTVVSFMPLLIAYIEIIPPVVIGSVFLYIMCSQLAVGLNMAINSKDGFNLETGLIIGFPLMLSIIISFLPTDLISTFPVILRPVLGNGFIVGVLAVLIMERVHVNRSPPKD